MCVCVTCHNSWENRGSQHVTLWQALDRCLWFEFDKMKTRLIINSKFVWGVCEKLFLRVHMKIMKTSLIFITSSLPLGSKCENQALFHNFAPTVRWEDGSLDHGWWLAQQRVSREPAHAGLSRAWPDLKTATCNHHHHHIHSSSSSSRCMDATPRPLCCPACKQLAVASWPTAF